VFFSSKENEEENSKCRVFERKKDSIWLIKWRKTTNYNVKTTSNRFSLCLVSVCLSLCVFKMSRRSSPPETTIDNETRYCICQKREDEFNEDDKNDFMIECDGCSGWFHGRCIGLADRIADDIEKYFCAQCSVEHGPSVLKQRKNKHRRDFSDANADNKPTQSGTQDFIQKLKRKVFPSCEPVITRLSGHQLTADYLLKTGFTRPILITNRDGLDLTLPDRTISLNEINDLVGPDRHIDIIDCEKQVTYKMSFDDYIEYFESFERNKIYNVLSLEISNTKLGEQIVIPRIVRDLSWATIGVWPEKKKSPNQNDQTDGSATAKKKRRVFSASDTDPSDDEFDGDDPNHFENFERPEVAKYCLMSPQSSYTDFHVDFGGSSVWYAVVRGEKIFYLIEPTDENLQKYADWTRSPTESETFLGDCVSHCYKMHLREDNTVFIPAGWIHAVYTVTDSLVFGGNFLQSMSVDMQLRIYELERLAQVPNKFQFPLFETFHWFAAKTFYDELKESNEKNSLTINPISQQAAESILHYMSKWLINDKRYQIRNRQIIPRGFNCEKLLKDLSRELDVAKLRCGSNGLSKGPSMSIVTQPIKVSLSIDKHQESVQLNNTKIKVKCRRLSSDSPSTGKTKPNVSTSGMKLTIKATLSGCRKPSSSQREIPKKKTTKTPKNVEIRSNPPEDEPTKPTTYTLDLEAKRQRFLQASDDANVSSNSLEIEENPEAIGGLASFVKRSPIHHDSPQQTKDPKIKRERSSSEQKILLANKTKKSKVSTPIDPSKATTKTLKKIKTEDVPRKKLVTSGNSSATTSPSTIKKRLSSPKKLDPTNRLSKILKIAHSIKSRGGILT